MADNPLLGVDPIVAEARERWTQCDEATDQQRKSILEAKQFRAGEQWPAAIKLAREGANAVQGQAAQPPRPCLTVDRLSPAVRVISNQIKSASFMISVLPNGFGADDETADLFKGYMRRVQVNARDEAPVEWAADQCIEGGIGWFRLRSDYVDERGTANPEDPLAPFDQELKLERVTNNLTVYCDPHAVKPTRSDAQFMLVTEDLSKDEFKRRWPNADIKSLEDFASTGDQSMAKGWVQADTIRIAEYWRIVYEDFTLLLLENGEIVRSDKVLKDIPKEMQGQPVKASRTVRAPKVEGYKINAVEVLEPMVWLGSRIPLIPILGEELNVDGQVVLRGIIQEGMDAQRMVNYTYSGAIEIFALGSKSPYIVAEEQLADYQAIWQTANTYNYSYLPYKPIPNVPPPTRQTSEAPIEAAVALMVKSEDAIKATTSIFDPSLGQVNPTQRSGRAIQSLQAQSDLGTSGYQNSVMRALVYAGELMVEVIPKITRPGQLLHIVGADDQPQQVIAGQHFVQQGKQAVPTTPQGQPLGQPPKGFDPQMAAGMVKFFDLNKGRYAVSVNIGKSSTTKREEGAAAMGELIPHLPPEMAAIATPEYVEQLSFEGAHMIAEKLRKALPPALQDDSDSPLPPQVQAMIQQLQTQNQQLQQMVQTKTAEVQAKGQIDLQKTQLQEQAENLRTEHTNQTSIQKALIAATATEAVAQAKSDAENFRSYVDASEERIAQMLSLHMAKHQAALEHLSSALDRRHELVTQASDQAHERQMAQIEHQHALEQGQQAAALAPPPTEAGNAGA